MINQQTANGTWTEAKGKMRERWGELTDNELAEAQGSMEQLMGYIQRKTGETRETIEYYLDEIGAFDAWEQTRDSIAQFTQATSETVQQTAQQAADQVKAGYIEAQRLVKRHPVEALAVTLGIGLVAGVVTGLVMRSR